MDTHFTFRNLKATEGLKSHSLEKLEKIKKYFIKPISANIIFSLNKFRQSCEISIVDSGKEYIGSETGTDMYKSIDRAIEKVEKQLKREKEKVKSHKVGQV